MAVGEGGSKNVIYYYYFFYFFYIALRIHGWIFPEKAEHRVLPNENHKRLPNCTKSRSFVEGLG